MIDAGVLHIEFVCAEYNFHLLHVFSQRLLRPAAALTVAYKLQMNCVSKCNECASGMSGNDHLK